MPQVSLNTKAPDFTLQTYQGEDFTLSSLQGKKLVLLVFNRTFK